MNDRDPLSVGYDVVRALVVLAVTVLALHQVSSAQMPGLPGGVPQGFGNPGEPQLTAEQKKTYATPGWKLLSGFSYQLPEPGALEGADLAARRDQIFPADVRALDGKKVALSGFVIPVEVDEHGVRSFLLSSKNDMGCCFGTGIGLTDWVYVTMPGGRSAEIKPFVPTTVLGTLTVGEEVQDGFVMSLYRLSADEVKGSS